MTNSNDFEKLAGGNQPTSKDQDIEALEAEVQRLSDRLNEERFTWTLVMIMLVDLAIFPGMSNWGAPIGIVIIQLILIVILAKRFGVEEVSLFLYRLAESWGAAIRRRRDQ